MKKNKNRLRSMLLGSVICLVIWFFYLGLDNINKHDTHHVTYEYEMLNGYKDQRLDYLVYHRDHIPNNVIVLRNDTLYVGREIKIFDVKSFKKLKHIVKE